MRAGFARRGLVMFWSGRLFGQDYAVWDNQPGGEIVDRYTLDGENFVVVEFKNSPGYKYVYKAP
jgi:hypothetical protein